MPRTAALAALAALLGFSALPAQAQTDSTQTAPPDTTAATGGVSFEDANEARRRFNEGFELLGQGSYQAALAKFDEGLALDPSNNRNAFGRAMALAQLDRPDEATAAFEQAIALSETAEDAETLGAARRAYGLLSYDRALVLLETNPLPQEAASQALPLLVVVEQALPLLQEAGDETVNANQLPYQLARVHNVLGNYEDAARYAEQAVELNAGAADMSAYYIELGLARRGAGDTAGARAAFEQARTGAWSGWAEHYLRELDAAGGESSGG
jgi:tetratricopeptide (TPR) repeat protein